MDEEIREAFRVNKVIISSHDVQFYISDERRRRLLS